MEDSELTRSRRAFPLNPLPHDTKSLAILANLVGPMNAAILLRHFGSLTAIGRADALELQAIVAALTDRHVATLSSAFALAAHVSNERLPAKNAIVGPADVANLVREEFRLLSKERLKLIAVDVKNHPIRIVTVSDGQQDSLTFDQREIFRISLHAKANSIFLAHNHPSCDPTPSRSDIEATKMIHRAGRLLNVPLIDHIIVAPPARDNQTDYASLQELGHLPPS